MAVLDYTQPGQIDADPADVGEIAEQQLARVLDEVSALAKATEVQVRSSYLTQQIDARPSVQPDELAEAWDDSREAGRLARVRGAIDAARAALTNR